MIQPLHIIDGVKVYSESQILSTMSIGREWSYEEESAYLFGWCAAMDAHYYAVPGDCFSLDAAINTAIKNKKDAVVINSLS